MKRQSALDEINRSVSEIGPSVSSRSNDKVLIQRSELFSATELLWFRRRLFLRTLLWALVAGTLVTLLIPTKYDSTTSIMPPEANADSGMMIAALAGRASPEIASLAGGLIGAKTNGAIVVALLGSRTVQERIVDRFNLQKVYWKRHKEDARRVLAERTSLAEDRKSGVISITVRDRSPKGARDMAQAYVEELNRLMSEVSTSSARRQRVFIEQRLATVSTDLADAEKQFSEFASKNTILDVKEQTKAMVESAATLQGQLIAAQSELQALEQIYSQNNVRVRAAHARVEELKAQLQKIDGSDASLVSDATQEDQLYPSIRKLPLLGVKWADLYRRMRTQETVYELLTQQYEMARIQEAKEIPTINVIDPPEIPESKAFPPRFLLITIIAVGSLIVAVFFVLGRSRLEQLEGDDPRRLLATRIFDQMSRITSHVRGVSPLGRTEHETWTPSQE